MDQIEERAMVKRLMNLYHQKGYEMTAREVGRAADAVVNRTDCSLEEAYHYIEEKIEKELKPL